MFEHCLSEILIKYSPSIRYMWYKIMSDTYSQTFLCFRDIFERAVNLKISVKKAKFLFKKYLAFEESHGTPATVNSVKDKAKAFVMTKTNEQESNNV